MDENLEISSLDQMNPNGIPWSLAKATKKTELIMNETYLPTLLVQS